MTNNSCQAAAGSRRRPNGLRAALQVALGLIVSGLAPPTFGETAPPPDWQDGASVYLAIQPESPPSAEPAPAAASPMRFDHSLAPAADQNTAPALGASAAAADRRLLPPSKPHKLAGAESSGAANNRLPGASQRLVEFGLPIQSIYTVISALAIVIGAFLLFAWLLRRGGPATASLLPAEAACVLGRMPLAARHYAELLRIGNKLVLVSLTPAGAETLTEVTEPSEVDRLLALCQQHGTHSTTQAFEQVFRQLSAEAPTGGFPGERPLPSSTVSYRAPREDAARG